METALQCARAEQGVTSLGALLQHGACSVDKTGVMNTMPHQGSDDPRKLREVIARTQTLAAEHAVASVVVGFAAREGSLLFPDFLAYLESELRVEDQIFRLTRERALLVLRDVEVQQAESVVERLRANFEREFPSSRGVDVKIRYLAVSPGPVSISVKSVLPAIFGGTVEPD
jgi:hypothetical protein